MWEERENVKSGEHIESTGSYWTIFTGNYTKNIVFSSGQIPASPETGEIVGTDITAQAEQVMENVKAILDEAGTCFENVVKTTCFLSDMADFAEFNKVYEKYFVSKPARSCVAVKTLPKNVLCEVEVIAEFSKSVLQITE